MKRTTITSLIVLSASAMLIGGGPLTQWAFEVVAPAGTPAFRVKDRAAGQMLDIANCAGEVIFRVGDLEDKYYGGSFAVGNQHILLNVDRTVASGDIEFSTGYHGVILRSPDGGTWRIRVDDEGNLFAVNAD